jgi:hypothetical protein
MRRILGWSSICCAILFLGCQQAEPAASPTAEAQPAAPATVEGFVIGAPIRYANLTIFPLSSPTPRTEDRFITLDAGLKAGTVTIMEQGSDAAVAAFAAAKETPTTVATAPVSSNETPAVAANPIADDIASFGADVNQLLVVNQSDKTLYLMPGEIIVGGQQDRAIGKEYVIAPGKKPVPIEVFCVEQGRWQDASIAETTRLQEAAQSQSAAGGSVVVYPAADLLLEVTKGKFVGSVGNVGREARIAVQGAKDQGKVWERVAATNDRSSVQSGSGAFTVNYTDDESTDRLEPYLKALQDPIAAGPQIVGVLTAVNGRMDTIDVFESTPLFLKLWPKLLKSYALDAANEAEPDRLAATCDREEAEKFLRKMAAAQLTETNADADLVSSTHSTDDVIRFSVHQKSEPTEASGGAMGGGMGGGGGGGYFGGAIHSGGGLY